MDVTIIFIVCLQCIVIRYMHYMMKTYRSQRLWDGPRVVSVQPVQPDVLYEEVPQARPINEMTSAEAARNVCISQKCTCLYVHTCSVQDVSDTTE